MDKVRCAVVVWLALTTGLVSSDGIGCIRDDQGLCMENCPDGTAEYSSGCSIAFSEPTCQHPVVVDMGPICDLSRCDCIPPTIRDTIINRCVQPEDCPSSYEDLDTEEDSEDSDSESDMNLFDFFFQLVV